MPQRAIFLRPGVLLLGYLALVVYGTIVPLNYQSLSWVDAVERFRNIHDFRLSVLSRADWLANVFLYVPLGWLTTWWLAGFGRSAIWHVIAALLSATAASGIAVALEFTQLWFPPRTVSMNDIRAEILGSAVGACGFHFASCFGPALLAWLKPTKNRASLVQFGRLYVLLLILSSVFPGDLVLSRAEFARQWQEGKIGLIPFHDLEGGIGGYYKLALQILLFVPVGIWAVGEWNRQNSHRLLSCSVTGGLTAVALSLGIELLQLGVYTRYSSATALVLACGGGALGGWLGGLLFYPHLRSRRMECLVAWARQRWFWSLVSVAYSLVVVAILLAPFRWIESESEQTLRWDLLFRPPFAALYYAPEFAAATNVIEKCLLFFILGTFISLAQRAGNKLPNSNAGQLAVVTLVATVLGTLIEIAQVYIDAYQPDLTDVLLYAAGAWAGSALVHCSQRSTRKECA